MSCCSHSEEVAPSNDEMPRTRLKFKITLVGDAGVGKTSLTNRYIFGDHLEPKSTVGAAFAQAMPLYHTNEEGDRYKIDCQLWDTAGQERFQSVMPMYYRGSDLIIVAFSVMERDSYNHIDSWIAKAHETCGDKIPIILAGCKGDLKTGVPHIPESQVLSDHALEYIETSSYTGVGVKELFHRVAFVLYQRHRNTALIKREDCIKELL